MNTLSIMPLGVVGIWQLVIIAFIVLLIFGGNKIPELMRGLGKGVKEFKAGMDEVEKELNRKSDSEEPKKETKVLEPDKIEKTK